MLRNMPEFDHEHAAALQAIWLAFVLIYFH